MKNINLELFPLQNKLTASNELLMQFIAVTNKMHGFSLQAEQMASYFLAGRFYSLKYIYFINIIVGQIFFLNKYSIKKGDILYIILQLGSFYTGRGTVSSNCTTSESKGP